MSCIISHIIIYADDIHLRCIIYNLSMGILLSSELGQKCYHYAPCGKVRSGVSETVDDTIKRRARVAFA